MQDVAGVTFILFGTAALWLRRYHAGNWIAEEIYQWYRRRNWMSVDLYLLIAGVAVIVGARILFGFCDSLPSRT